MSLYIMSTRQLKKRVDASDAAPAFMALVSLSSGPGLLGGGAQTAPWRLFFLTH